ncbi:MAG: CHASE4 domain-containing protein [Candidatus Moraniibacteriota bacterium]
MGLRLKVFLSTSMVLIVAFFLINQLLTRSIESDFLALEQREVKINTNRVEDALQTRVDDQAAKLGDWAQWDDTYTFITDRNNEYIQSNLQNEAFGLLHVDMIVLTDISGHIIFQKYVHDGQEEAFPESFSRHLSEDIAAGEVDTSSGTAHAEIIETSDGVIVTTIRPVTSSDGTAEANGFIVFGHFFDEHIVADISRVTHVTTEYVFYAAGLLDSGFLEARARLTAENPFLIAYSGDGEKVFGYTLIRDEAGSPVVILRVRMNRDIYMTGRENIALFTRIIIMAGFVFIIILSALIHWLVLRKVLSLSRQVGEVRDAENSSQQISLTGSDEFSILAGDVNNMLRVMRERNRFLEDTRKAVSNILEDSIESEKTLQRQTTELQKFQQAVDASFDHMIITDADGVILHANHAAEVLTGYTKEEMIGLKPSLWGKQMSRSFYETFWQTIKVEKQGYAGEVTNKRKGGKLYLASIRVSSILDAAGEVKFFVGIERDITEDRETQRKIIRHADELEVANTHIEEQKDRAESILRFLKSIGEGVFATDIAGNIIFINETAQRMSRDPLSNAEGRKVSEAFSFVQAMPYQSVMIPLVEQSLESKKTISFPLNTASVQHTMAKIPVAGTCSLIRDTKNDIIGAIVVFRDVTQLRELDQMKNNFLSTAAHQLRTPLGSMRWSAELLINGDFGKLPKAAKEIVRQIYDNNVRMVLLVNDLLDVSRIDSEKGREEKQLVDIATLLQEIIHTMQSEARKRSVKIILTLPKEPLPLLLMPAKHLYEALENLVSNGIKYNKKRGILTLTVKIDASAILLTVADTGIGIPKEDTAKIFSKFFRSANAVLKETEGSGLGLSVVKSYLEESGAKISFKSEENIGTTFLVEFPLDSAEEHT